MLKRWYLDCIAKCTPNCEEMARLASESLERRLTLKERFLFNLHEGICFFCKRYKKQIHTLHHILREDGESLSESSSERLSEDCKSRLKTLLKNKD